MCGDLTGFVPGWRDSGAAQFPELPHSLALTVLEGFIVQTHKFNEPAWMHIVTRGVSVQNIGTILSPARLCCSQAINFPKEIKKEMWHLGHSVCCLYILERRTKHMLLTANRRVFVCFLFVPIKIFSTCQSWEPLIHHLPVLGALLHPLLKLMQVVLPCFAAGFAVTHGFSLRFF